MLVKEADDQTALLEELEGRTAGAGPDAKRAKEELRIRRAGLKGERQSAYLIDFEFAKSRNWAVLHDLRFQHGDRVAQIDHLLINRWMDFYVLESKHLHAGLKITDEGEFLQWDDFRRRFIGMSCPLTQNARHIAVLAGLVDQIQLPERLGFRITPTFHSLVLVSPNARIDRSKRFDSSRVIKADQLKKRIWRDIDEEGSVRGLIKTAAKIVSSETVEHVARQLAALHQPRIFTPRADSSQAGAPCAETSAGPQPPRDLPARVANSPAHLRPPNCKSCGAAPEEVRHGRYGYYFSCGTCGSNTAIKFSCHPGHKPRLRKQAAQFFRDCEECNTSDLYFTNRNSG